MLVSDIYNELKEMVGVCDQSVIFSTATRAVELLSAKGLWDPLIGTVDIAVANQYLVALPRMVKTPIRINLAGNPAFARNQLFEFLPNSDGSVVGEEVDWSWASRGYTPIQSWTALPSVLNYLCLNAADNNKTITVKGLDASGREITETLVGLATSPVPGTQAFTTITEVQRQSTTYGCHLRAGTTVLANYYPDETEPQYRLIKISKSDASIRVLFRKHTHTITALTDIIPLHSPMALLQACRAVRLYMQGNDAEGDKKMELAEKFINDEQGSRDEFESIGKGIEVITASNRNINTRDSLIVADVYDVACEICGAIGRRKIFDKITNAVEVLANKAHWDAMLGHVDIWRADNTDVNISGSTGSGYFVLPRYVDTVLALGLSTETMRPRNKWFEYHLNAIGERNLAPPGCWDDTGETVIINPMPIDVTTHLVTPQKLVCIPDSAADNATEVRVFGYERLSDGSEKWIRVGGVDGFLAPCVYGSLTPNPSAPDIVRIERITKEASTGFIKLVTVVGGLESRLLGYYYPDETEPKYQSIKIHGSKAIRIRIMYRKRTTKFTSLFDPIHLRSRLAIEHMLRSIEAYKTDIQQAVTLDAMAINLLRDEQVIRNPHGGQTLQFPPGVEPGYVGRVL